ncbi:hypothetical protein Tco_0906944 [Tanacetum coccineum]|uniref:Retrotransposon gag domain-containing protein n=1 Tax=Tanacetum coccineum TaxID=301880 RepID=A0ABQ5CP54_9ASTR
MVAMVVELLVLDTIISKRMLDMVVDEPLESSTIVPYWKENGVNILKSIDEGPFQMGTTRDTLAEGTEGSKLTKEDQESQLYDDFEHFCQNKGETIYDYYVRFTKLINDMRNIKMTMSRMQLNSKFVNNMLPEWGRFVTAVKLNRCRHNRGQGNNVWGAGAAGYGVLSKRRVVNAIQVPIKTDKSATTATENRVALDEDKLLFLVGEQDNAVDEDVDEQPMHDLTLNVDNVFQADNKCFL